MRRAAFGLLLVLGAVWLVGCQAITDAVLGELESISQPSEYAVEIETVAATISVPTPTVAPLVTPTPRGRQITALTPEPEATNTPLLPTPTPEPNAGLMQACTTLWGTMQAGEELVQEWHAWFAEDPASPQIHQARLRLFAQSWEAHARHAASMAVDTRLAPVKEAYLQAVRTYWGSALLGLETLSRGDQRTGSQAEELAAQADRLWYLAYDQIDAVCDEAYAGGVPLPTIPAPKPPTPTAPAP